MRNKNVRRFGLDLDSIIAITLVYLWVEVTNHPSRLPGKMLHMFCVRFCIFLGHGWEASQDGAKLVADDIPETFIIISTEYGRWFVSILFLTRQHPVAPSPSGGCPQPHSKNNAKMIRHVEVMKYSR
jgi:hypothetical protein